jgi:hypothetical protein
MPPHFLMDDESVRIVGKRLQQQLEAGAIVPAAAT